DPPGRRVARSATDDDGRRHPVSRSRPVSTSSGTSGAASSSTPTGAYTKRSRRTRSGRGRATSAEERAVLVADEARGRRAAHEQEAGRAELFVGPLGLEAVTALAPLLGFGLLLVLVGGVLGGDEAVLEDGIQIGLDVVGVDDVLVVLLVLGGDGTPGRLLFLLFLVLH